MEADSIGDDLEPFLLDIMSGADLHINDDMIDDMYDHTAMLEAEQPRQIPTGRPVYTQSRENIQNILPVMEETHRYQSKRQDYARQILILFFCSFFGRW